MKKHLDKVINLVLTISIYFYATAFFPHIGNKDLLQTKADIHKITVFILLVIYLAFVALSGRWKISRLPYFATIGLTLMVLFFTSVFLFYYPFANRKVVNIKFECGDTYLIGDSVNYDKLSLGKKDYYDSLSTNDPAAFIQGTDCNPSLAWTFESIEHNYNKLLIRYFGTLIFFSLGIFFLLKAGLKKFIP